MALCRKIIPLYSMLPECLTSSKGLQLIMLKTLKTRLKTSQDILYSNLKKKVEEEFDELLKLYLIQLNMFMSPKIFFKENITRAHKHEELINEYNQKLNIFLQEYSAVINSQFHDRKWSLIIFVLNDQYNNYFFEHHAQFLDNAQDFHETCIETLNNSLAVISNSSSTRIKI